MTTAEGLEPPRLPGPTGRSRTLRMIAFAAVAAIGIGWAAWFVSSPEELGVSDETVSADGVAGAPVFVGMYSVPGDGDRTLHISDVDVTVDGSDAVTVTPMLCRGGSVEVTTDPDAYCDDTADPAGAQMRSGDSIMVRLEADEAAEATVQRLEISYRDGFSWDTQPAGVAGVDVTFVTRPDVEPRERDRQRDRKGDRNRDEAPTRRDDARERRRDRQRL